VAWAGPCQGIPLEWSAAPSVDLADFVAIPGLVDAHTHLTLFADGRPYEAMAAETDAMMLLAAARNARTHLESGVTTARDNGCRNRLALALKEAIARQLLEGPRLFVAGRPVTPSRGHFHFCNGEADDEGAIRLLVGELVDEGADHIKIMASGGGTVGTDPGRASYSVEELAAAVDAAHRLSRLTTAHCRAQESMQRAIEAGVDCIEHADFLRADGHVEFDAALAARLCEAAIYISPTLQARRWDTILRLRGEAQTRTLTVGEAAVLARAEDGMRSALETFGAMLDTGLGGRIVGGTDSGCFDFSFGHIDYCLDLMVQGGMAPMDAIRACTSVAAAAIGIGDVVGSITPGRMADLVVLGGDPSRDIRFASEVRAVVQGGRCVVSSLPQLQREPL
jgi:imidazolonepropionase-like amidohydrolase